MGRFLPVAAAFVGSLALVSTGTVVNINRNDRSGAERVSLTLPLDSDAVDDHERGAHDRVTLVRAYRHALTRPVAHGRVARIRWLLSVTT